MLYNGMIKVWECGMFEHVSFYKTLESFEKSVKSGTYLLMIAQETLFLELPKKKGLVYAGAIFPKIIFKQKTYSSGLIAAKLSKTSTLHIMDIHKECNTLSSIHNSHSIFTIVDGYSTAIYDFLENLYTLIPETCKIIGAGSGKNTLIQELTIFDQTRFYLESAIVIASQKSIGLGVKHGWKPLHGPLIVSQCHHTTIEKMNYEDAFEVYKNAIEAKSNLRFDSTPFFEISQRYPIGLVRYNQDFLVREPVSTDGKSIKVVGKLEQNSIVCILTCKENELIQAAHEAAMLSRESKGKEAIHSVMVVDCISRFLVLDKKYSQELKAIAKAYEPQTLLWGVLSVGEIANANQEGIEFYNNTCVIGTL